MNGNICHRFIELGQPLHLFTHSIKPRVAMSNFVIQIESLKVKKSLKV